MKEHPDYKYRPRRKPKALMKKEPKFGFPMSSLLSPVPRLLAPAPPPHHPLFNPDGKLDLSRTFFPPFPYPFYPFGPKLPGEDLAAELAQLGALCPNGWWSAASGACGCRPRSPPSPPAPLAATERSVVVVRQEQGQEQEPPQHVIWRPLPVLPARGALGMWGCYDRAGPSLERSPSRDSN